MLAYNKIGEATRKFKTWHDKCQGQRLTQTSTRRQKTKTACEIILLSILVAVGIA
jgi:hypothetical protein